MEEKIKQALQQFEEEIKQITDEQSLETLRIKFLGRKGLFAELFEEFNKGFRKTEKEIKRRV